MLILRVRGQLLAAVAFGQLLAPSQLLGGALLLSAGIAVQTVPARPARPARGGQGLPHRQPPGRPAGSFQRKIND